MDSENVEDSPKDVKYKERLLAVAAQVHTIRELCFVCKTSKDRYYAFVKTRAEFDATIKSLLGTNAVDIKEIKKKARQFGKLSKEANLKPSELKALEADKASKVIIINKPEKNTKTGEKLTLQMRFDIGIKVCELYEKGVTKVDALEAVGIGATAFDRWISPLNNDLYIKELRERWEEAVRTRHENRFLGITEKAFEGLDMLVTQREVTEQKTFYKVGKDGVAKVSGSTLTKKRIEPNVAAVQFALVAYDPAKFNNRQFVDTATARESDPYFYRSLSIEQMDAEQKLLEEKLKSY